MRWDLIFNCMLSWLLNSVLCVYIIYLDLLGAGVVAPAWNACCQSHVLCAVTQALLRHPSEAADNGSGPWHPAPAVGGPDVPGSSVAGVLGSSDRMLFQIAACDTMC